MTKCKTKQKQKNGLKRQKGEDYCGTGICADYMRTRQPGVLMKKRKNTTKSPRGRQSLTYLKLTQNDLGRRFEELDEIAPDRIKY